MDPTCHDAGRGGALSDTQIRDDARKALEDHAWQDAYEGLVSLRDRGELTGEDWHRLGEAAWWTAHPSESLEALNRWLATCLAPSVTPRHPARASTEPLG